MDPRTTWIGVETKENLTTNEISTGKEKNWIRDILYGMAAAEEKALSELEYNHNFGED